MERGRGQERGRRLKKQEAVCSIKDDGALPACRAHSVALVLPPVSAHQRPEPGDIPLLNLAGCRRMVGKLWAGAQGIALSYIVLTAAGSDSGIALRLLWWKKTKTTQWTRDWITWSNVGSCILYVCGLQHSMKPSGPWFLMGNSECGASATAGPVVLHTTCPWPPAGRLGSQPQGACWEPRTPRVLCCSPPAPRGSHPVSAPCR